MSGFGSAGKFYFIYFLKVLFLSCDIVGTVDWMCFPWQPRSAQG